MDLPDHCKIYRHSSFGPEVIYIFVFWQLGFKLLVLVLYYLSTECHANGTMTTLALKVESAPYLIPSQLTLIDRSCKPVFSNDQFASFSFPLNSCGTVRMVSFYFKLLWMCIYFLLNDPTFLFPFCSFQMTL